jgi:hypothetical protein
MLVLREAIIENSDLVCVGERILRQQIAVLAREAGWAGLLRLSRRFS